MVLLKKPLKGFVTLPLDLEAKGGVVPLETRDLLLEARVRFLETILLHLKELNLREELLGLLHLLLLDQPPLLLVLLGGGPGRSVTW